ncbi:DNA-binding transcriptional MerR regulator [Nocardia tenerifensis]|uniref:DNA-binding transcriptional MerR regulator n=1 Tax=Nocardia tenerifensis TaxID=228006 RepID=A0A318K728_9NOCA|nr:MerR family transcriptional regulator [Nocardia tenerifensis]PXX69148.1 DNA-binding transcriptional MerR regulator [Nocardia tenerifensis]
MLIGELARRTAVSTRLLRYYEEQGLLRPQRDALGYRSYADDAPEQVQHIRYLLAAGLSTEDIRGLLPCAIGKVTKTIESCDATLRIIESRYSELDNKIAELERQRALLTEERAAIRDGMPATH